MKYVLEDLKQFITAVSYRQTTDTQDDIDRLNQKVDVVEQNLLHRIDDLHTKIDSLLGSHNRSAKQQ